MLQRIIQWEMQLDLIKAFSLLLLNKYIEKAGATMWYQSFRMVRKVIGQAARWRVHGAIQGRGFESFLANYQ